MINNALQINVKFIKWIRIPKNYVYFLTELNGSEFSIKTRIPNKIIKNK